ncbi:hypothetical protein OJF2_75770 [Aquisphaera giovannonii]|uniref:Uncharacterized protein n=1 Tax=Aquisphaera giovannonii TaxID=406548 RepID=A0A5B9WG23_9BACT|nr:hypothetical protein OJF2_75770 [Aquisphaera giovannonii]
MAEAVAPSPYPAPTVGGGDRNCASLADRDKPSEARAGRDTLSGWLRQSRRRCRGIASAREPGPAARDGGPGRGMAFGGGSRLRLTAGASRVTSGPSGP